MLQNLKVILNYRILKHICIHGRGNEFLAFACHDRGSKHIICNSMSQFANHIGACRCDHYDICFLCDRYMLYLELEIPVKGIYQAFIACESLKSDRIDKVRRIFCHKYMNICAAFL